MLHQQLPRLLTSQLFKLKETKEREPLPLSDAARQLLENPPSLDRVPDKDKQEKKEEEFLDIPSFVRTQLD